MFYVSFVLYAYIFFVEESFDDFYERVCLLWVGHDCAWFSVFVGLLRDFEKSVITNWFLAVLFVLFYSVFCESGFRCCLSSVVIFFLLGG